MRVNNNLFILKYKEVCKNAQMTELTQYHERIAYLIASTEGMSQSELARRLGVSQQSVNYLATKAKGSTHNGKISAIFGVDPVWLQNGTGPKRREARDSSGPSQCPIVTWDDLHKGIYGEIDPIGYLPIDRKYGDDLICAQFSGDSMSPPISRGCQIVMNYSDSAINLVYKKASTSDINLVVAVIDNDKITLRNFIKDGSDLMLVPFNHAYPSVAFNKDKDKIIGQVLLSINELTN